MKKLLLLLCVAVLALPSFGVKIGSLYYTLNSSTGTATVTYSTTNKPTVTNPSYSSLSGTIVIPETVVSSSGTEYTVTSIGDYAFMYNTTITSVIIPNTVTSIGRYAFNACSKLTSVEIPKGVISIGEDAFQHCYKLTSVTIPNSVNTLGTYCFDGCTSLTSVTIPNSVTSMGTYCFDGCTSLKSVTLSNSLTNIPDYAFRDCSSLTSVTIPNSVNTLGSYCFSGCSSLQSVTLSNSLTGIPTYAFRNCSNLTSIAIPESVTSIGERAFNGCSNLTKLFIPSSVKTIGSNAFTGCTAVKLALYPATANINFANASKILYTDTRNYEIEDNVVFSPDKRTVYFAPSSLEDYEIPETVTNIWEYAFAFCDKVNEIMIPGETTSIAANAFLDMTSLTDLYLQRGNEPLNIVPEALTGTSVKNLYLGRDIDVALGWGPSLQSVSVLANVTRIARNAFKDCTGLTTATFANNGSLTTIGASAFDGCSALGEVKLPATLETLGEAAFRNCSAMQSATLSDKMITINNETFSGCSKLTDITLPQGITTIGPSAFKNCAALPTLNIPVGVKAISSSTFYGCSTLDNIVLPSGLTAVNTEAFRDCSALSAISLPNNVTTIGANAFNGCSSLASVKLSEGLTSVADGAFEGCTALADITLTEKIATLGANAFKGCTSMTEAVLNAALTTIGASAFEGCTELASVTMPAELTSVGSRAFYGDAALKEITLEQKVQTVGSAAFDGCTGLATVYSLAEVPPTCADVNSFASETQANAELYVPTYHIEDYKVSKCWKEFKNFNGLTEVSRVEITGSSERLRVGKTMNLTATVTPEDATFPEVTWTSNNTAVATVSEAGVVTAVSTGYVVITARAKDAKVTEGTYALNIIDVLMGDANDNDAVTVTDAAAIAGYVMGEQPEVFNEEAADVNESGDITLADASGVITIVLNDIADVNDAEMHTLAMWAPAAGDRLVADNFCQSDRAEIAVSLVSDREFVALQADIVARGGISLDNVVASTELAATHQVTTKRVSDNTIRVVVFSPVLDVMANSNLFNVTVNGAATDNDGISIVNLLATTPDLNEYALGFEGGRYDSDLSGVDSVDARRYTLTTEGSALTVAGADGLRVNVFTASGMCVGAVASASASETFILNAGIYMVQIGDNVEKVIVK